jgi:hypothetical protein
MARKRGSPYYEQERKEAKELGILDDRYSSMLEGSEEQVERNLANRREEWEEGIEDLFRRFRGEE